MNKFLQYFILFFLLISCDRNPYKKGDGDVIFGNNLLTDKYNEDEIIDLSRMGSNVNCKLNSDHNESYEKTHHIYDGGFDFKKIDTFDLLLKENNFNQNFSPVYCNNYFYHINDYGILSAYFVDPKEKKIQKRWSFHLLDNFKKIRDYKVANITLDNKDRLFITTNYGDILSIHAIHGKLIWKKNYKSGFFSSTTYDSEKDRLYITSTSDEIYSINATNGEVVFKDKRFINKSTTSSLLVAPVVIHDNNIVVSLSSGQILYFNKEDFTLRWKYRLTNNQPIGNIVSINDIDYKPVIVGSILFVGGIKTSIMGIDLEAGKPIWNVDLTVNSNIVHNDKDVVFFFSDKTLVALNVHNGKVIWSNNKLATEYKDERPNYLTANGSLLFQNKLYNLYPIIINESIFVNNILGYFYEIDIHTGKIKNKHNITHMIQSSPIFLNSDNMLLFDTFNNLYQN